MWWDEQNLAEPRRGRNGTIWHFLVWHDVVSLKHVARVFFWDDRRTTTGVVVLPPSARTDVSALRGLIQKLAADPQLRARHLRELRFPLQRHYSDYGAFPGESTGAVEE